MQQIFFVGSYTHPSLGGKGQGIYTCGLETSTGAMTLLNTLPVTNPSYLIFDKQREYAFAVEESGADLNPHVHSFKVSPEGRLEALSQRPIPGEYACHLGVDAENKFLAVANYGTGSVVLYGLQGGKLTGPLDVVQHQGKSVNAERQEGPHAHAAVFSPDNDFVFVVDMGLDEVRSYTFASGKLLFHNTFKTKPGSGPRHLEFHPSGKYAFLINELDATVTVVRYEAGGLSEVQTLPTLPSDYTGEKWAAALHVSPNGKNVYASNRKHDSIAIFAFDLESGSLEPLQQVPSGGSTPRDFSLDNAGKFLITAHQNSDDLYSFFVDETGRLEPTGRRLELGSPVCVKML